MSVTDYHRALQLWRDFDRARTELTARLYNGRDNPEYIQNLLDENESLHRQVLELTNQLLGKPD
jgi:hypothetical protein